MFKIVCNIHGLRDIVKKTFEDGVWGVRKKSCTLLFLLQSNLVNSELLKRKNSVSEIITMCRPFNIPKCLLYQFFEFRVSDAYMSANIIQ